MIDAKKYEKYIWAVPASIIVFLIYIFLSVNDRSSAPKSVEHIPDRKIQITEDSPSKYRPDKLPLFKKNLEKFPGYYQDFIIHHSDNELIEDLENCKTLEEAVIVITKYIDPEFLGSQLTSWLDWVQFDLRNSSWGGKSFKDLDPSTQMSALSTYLIKDKHFKYVDKVTPEAYSMSKVIERGEGLCATLPIVFALICERLKMPVHLVTSRNHVFCRYDDGETRINIESTSPHAMGVGTPDEFYLKQESSGEDIVTKHELAATSTMKNLNLRESISILLLNASAATVNEEKFLDDFKRGYANNEEELKNDLKYWVSSYYFNPNSYLSIRNLLSTVQKHHERFDNNLVYVLRSYAIRKGVINGNEEDLKILVKDIKALKSDHQELLGMYSSLDSKDFAKLNRFKKETGTRLIELHRFMKANKYILTNKFEKELSEIKLRYIKLYKWADIE